MEIKQTTCNQQKGKEKNKVKPLSAVKITRHILSSLPLIEYKTAYQISDCLAFSCCASQTKTASYPFSSRRIPVERKLVIGNVSAMNILYFNVMLTSTLLQCFLSWSCGPKEEQMFVFSLALHNRFHNNSSVVLGLQQQCPLNQDYYIETLTILYI